MLHNITILRKEVDNIDDKIAELLAKRRSYSDEIIKHKINADIPIYDADRETDILNRLKYKFSDVLDNFQIEHIFGDILYYSKINYFKLSGLSDLSLEEVLSKAPFFIAGPCTVESELQINDVASRLSEIGIRLLRGGTFKPRTSPHAFQGLEDEGVELLRNAADKYNMFVVSEFTDSEQLYRHYEKIDIIQIGSRNMTSSGFLKQVGKATSKDKKPVILKRGFSSTLKEFLLASQYIINEGNPNVILCLRGIRTFEQIDSELRFTSDLASIIELKRNSPLKVIFDPSHATGKANYIYPISKAALALGADGLMIECHTKPETSISDSEQTISPQELERILELINHKPIC
jgi:3-deoxy-7-phosphoheptulonate synthase